MCVCVCVCVCVQVLKDLNNFAGMFVVNAAFESSAVYRLKNTLVGAITPSRGKRGVVLSNRGGGDWEGLFTLHHNHCREQFHRRS